MHAGETELAAQHHEVQQMHAAKRKVRVLFHFNHHGAEVFSVDAEEAQIPFENWFGKKKISFDCDASFMNCDGELVLERTRTTEGIWSTFYYVKIPRALSSNCSVATLEIEIESEQ